MNSIGLISIIFPVLNAEKFMRFALDSIMSQTYTDFEIIIVDGGSIDNTISIAESYPKVKIIKQVDKGLAGAWNDGIRNVSGSFISFLDSDDVWDKHCLEWHITSLIKNPSLLGSVGKLQFVLEKNQIPPKSFKLSLLDENQVAYMPGCFLGRKEIIDLIGYFETRFEIASDIVWFTKVKDLNEKIGILDDVVLYKRVHDSNLSYTTSEKPVYDKELLKLLFERIHSKK